MNAIEQTLINARRRIEKSENWTRYGYDLSPTRRCIITAITEATSHDASRTGPALNVISDVLHELGVAHRGAIWFNANHTHAEILSVFDKAIAKARVVA